MSPTHQILDKTWLLPASSGELERFVQNTLGHFLHQPEQERAAVYSRVSNIDPKARTYSMEYQPDRAEEYAISKGWVIVSSYADPDRTGRNSRRPGLQALIRDVQSGKVTVVVVHRLDRLYRNLESLLRFLRFLKKHRVRLISVTEQIDTDSWWGRLVLYVLGALAEMYVWQTSVRVREIKAEMTRKGLHNGLIPYGYCNGLCSTCSDLNGPGYCPLSGEPDRTESQRGRIPVPHPIDKFSVQLIHALYQEGLSDKDIAHYLNVTSFYLPDGQVVKFRTKGIRNQYPDRPFTRDSIRGIVGNPFYAGLVARHPSKPLDMDDESLPGVSEKTSNGLPSLLNPEGSKRTITEMHPGRHQAIISPGLWKANQQKRKQKGATPETGQRTLQEYLLTGVALCWECFEWDSRQASLRGVKGSRNYYYRCATVQDAYKTHKKKPTGKTFESISVVGLGIHNQDTQESLLDIHRASLQRNYMEDQVASIIEGLEIPEEWYERILAYYLSDWGMSSFELQGYNLRQELTRQRELFRLGYITQAEYERAVTAIDRQLRQLQPSAQPETSQVAPLLKDFMKLWEQMNLVERRALLKTMFLGLYFDSQSQLRKVAAQSPFDRILRTLKTEN